MKKFLLPLLGLAILPAYAAGNLTLTFDVDGITNAEEIGVNVAGIEGVTASVKSCNADLKELADPAILCPNVNGNTSMDFILEIELKGLPAGTTFDGASMYAWAYNGAGGLQQYPWDEKNRNFTVELAIDNKTLVEFVDIDIAASVEEANEGAEFEESGETVSAGNPAVLEIHITSDSATNVGCFFGLETLTLNVAEGGSSGEGGEGEEPGEEPGENEGAIIIEPGFDSGYFYKGGTELQETWPYNGTFLGITGNCFLVGKWESADGEVSINATSNDTPGEGYNNNLWYFENVGFAMSGNPAATVENPYIYTFIAGEGLVIKSIHFVAEPSLTATEDQTFVYDGEEYVAEVGGQPLEMNLTDINEAEVWLGLVGYNQGVMISDLYITLVEEGSTAVKGLESVDVDAPVVFYDLQGRKVANPSKGIFIRQQGNKATKVVVK